MIQNHDKFLLKIYILVFIIYSFIFSLFLLFSDNSMRSYRITLSFLQ